MKRGVGLSKFGVRTKKFHPLLVTPTAINLGLLTLQVVRPRLAFTQEAGPVLRGAA